ncbi:MAG: hypothetical protein P8N02_12600 [Actinomycetota bacterium]|nr:hypothetical protein [Actinomycetota bacterium]
MNAGIDHKRADSNSGNMRAYADRVVFACAECGEPVTWPVFEEPSRRRRGEHQPPSEGRFRSTFRRDGIEVVLLPHTAARLAPNIGFKQARTCPNGHYVGDLRSEPHRPPWYLELRAAAVADQPARANCRA